MNDYQSGSTSVVETIFLQDSASSTGAGKTGLAYNTSGLTCYYKRSNGTASVAVSLVDITTLGTFVSGGFKAIDATGMPGEYEFHPPDAAFAGGAKHVTFHFLGTGVFPRPLKFAISTPTYTAQSGSTTTLRLDAADPLIGANLAGWQITATGGAGAGQQAVVVSSSAGTQTFPAVGVAFNGTTTYQLSAPSLMPVIAGTVTDKTGYTLTVTPPTAAQIRTEMDSNSTQLAAIIAANDLSSPVTISSSSPTATNFAVVFTGTAPAAASLVGLQCAFTGTGKKPAKLFIATASAIDSTHVGLTFASPGFAITPAQNDTVEII